MNYKITIIGSGNVATHLASVFFNRGFEIIQVFSRNIENATVLANSVNAEAIDDLSKLNINSDFFIISVSDSSIETVVNSMPKVAGIVMHTAGSIGIEVLSKFNNFGVLYPFQTFTKGKTIDFNEVPILIEASNVDVLKSVELIAKSLSSNVIEADTIRRKNVHLSAVFASNFVNHLYSIADNLLSLNDISFDILKPLIKETTEKIMKMHPIQAQTGPAQREDYNVIKEHLKILEKNKNEFDIYKILTESIISYKK